MFYTFCRYLFEIAMRVFFRRVKVNHADRIPEEGPLIVVANHPSTFMDPLLVARLLKQKAYFIGKASLFSTPFRSWMFSKVMNVIPIFRAQDDPSKTHLNKQIFQRCFDHLEGKGTLLIFPEGTSINERRLRKVKTGTARIALGAEEDNNFQLGIKIVSVGLNYSDPARFRSEVEINVEEPIVVSDFKTAYEQDERQTVRELTELIRINLEKNLIITDDDNEDELVRNIETIYRKKLVEDLDLDLDPTFQHFDLTKNIVKAVDYFDEHEPERVNELDRRMDDYFETLSVLQLKDNVFAKESRNRHIVANALQKGVYMFATFPIYLYGLIMNYIPYKLPSIIASKLTPDEEYMGPTKMVLGMFLFPIFYALLVGLFNYYITDSFWWNVLFFISLPISAFFALHYYGRLQNARDHWRLYSLFYRRTTLISDIIQQRTQIINLLEKAKDDYLAAASTNSLIESKYVSE